MRFVIRKCEKSGRCLRNRGREFPSLPLSRSNLSGLEKAHETIVYHNICARLRHWIMSRGHERRREKRESKEIAGVHLGRRERKRERVIPGTDVRWGQGGERGRILTRSGQITAPINYLRLRGLRDPRFDRAMGEEYSYFHDDISSMFVIKTDGNNPPKKKRF